MRELGIEPACLESSVKGLFYHVNHWKKHIESLAQAIPINTLIISLTSSPEAYIICNAWSLSIKQIILDTCTYKRIETS